MAQPPRDLVARVEARAREVAAKRKKSDAPDDRDMVIDKLMAALKAEDKAAVRQALDAYVEIARG